jgi:hypothetical protein
LPRQIGRAVAPFADRLAPQILVPFEAADHNVARPGAGDFAAHDARRQAEKATAARDVPVGRSWAFRNHRTMAEIIARKTPAT